MPPSAIANSIHSCIFTWKPNPCIPNVRCPSKSEQSDPSGLALQTFQGRSLEKLGTLNLIRCYSTSFMVERCPIPSRCTHLPADTSHLFVSYFTPLQKYHQATIKINLKDLKPTHIEVQPSILLTSLFFAVVTQVQIFVAAFTTPCSFILIQSPCHAHLIPHPTSSSLIFSILFLRTHLCLPALHCSPS